MHEEEPDPGMESPGITDEEAAEERSLFADIGTLIEDGRTLVEAEIAYQKTRAGYAGKQVCYLAIVGAFIGLMAALALLALVLGAVMALAPIFTPWGAGLVVAAVLLLIAFLGLALAARLWKNLRGAFGDGRK